MNSGTCTQIARSRIWASIDYGVPILDDLTPLRPRLPDGKRTRRSILDAAPAVFAAVLEDVYAGMREIEGSLQLDELHAAHPDWVRLISAANIHGAQHMLISPTIASRERRHRRNPAGHPHAGCAPRRVPAQRRSAPLAPVDRFRLFPPCFEPAYLGGDLPA